MVGWLSGTLGYAYNPERHGSAPDWAMDLVNVGFRKPKVRNTTTTLHRKTLYGKLKWLFLDLPSLACTLRK
jgi:hypothetical protein